MYSKPHERANKETLINTLIWAFFCLAIVYAVFVVARFWWYVEIEMLAGDVIGGVFPRYLKGSGFYELTHHNYAQSLIQFAMLWADIYIGPYPFWTRSFAYLSWFVFFLTLRSSGVQPQSNVLVSATLLIWFSYKNSASLYTYPWVHVEVGCQLLSLSAAIGAVKTINSGRTILIIFLTSLCFLFSHVHKGFYFPLVLGWLAVFISQPKAQRYAFFFLSVFYLIYIVWADGFLMGFYKEAGTNPFPVDWWSRAVATSALSTAVIGSVAQQFGTGLQLYFFRGAVFLGGLYIIVACLWRVVWLRDSRAALPLIFLLPALGMTFTTVIGRLSLMGLEQLQYGERYWYYSVLFSLGILLFLREYCAALLSKVALAFYLVCGLVLAAVSPTNQNYQISYVYRMNALQIARAVNPDIRWVYQWYTPELVTGYFLSRDELKSLSAEVFGWRGFDLVKHDFEPGISPLPECDVSDLKDVSVDLGGEPARMVELELPSYHQSTFAIAWSNNDIVSMSYVLKMTPQTLIMYMPTNLTTNIVLYQVQSTQNLKEICKVSLNPADL